MELTQLRHSIAELAKLTPTSEPFLTCYLNLEQDPEELWHRCLPVLRRKHGGPERMALEEAIRMLREQWDTWDEDRHRSVAMFARGGPDPVVRVLPFRASVRGWMSTSPIPGLYGLAEIGDNYDRFLLAMVREDRVTITETELGRAMAEIEAKREEAAETLERLMDRRGHRFVVLAGPKWSVNQFQQGLSRRVLSKIAGRMDATVQESATLMVRRAVERFLEWEDHESQLMVSQLRESLELSNRAASGVDACRRLLTEDRVEMVVLNQRSEREIARLWVQRQPLDAHDEIVWLAARAGVHVEIVRYSEELAKLGGMGVLLKSARDLKWPGGVNLAPIHEEPGAPGESQPLVC